MAESVEERVKMMLHETQDVQDEFIRQFKASSIKCLDLTTRQYSDFLKQEVDTQDARDVY
jgi:hypothetical protein